MALRPIPAYLADLFGTRFVGAIHGRLLTAWSAAGVLGPVLVNYIRQYQIDHGVARAQAYNVTMYLMAGLLLLGLIANQAVRPVDPKHHLAEAEGAHRPVERMPVMESVPAARPERGWALVALAWLAVGIPLAWGVSGTLSKAAALFR